MNIELLNEYKVIEWTENHWINVNLLNEYRIIDLIESI